MWRQLLPPNFPRIRQTDEKVYPRCNCVTNMANQPPLRAVATANTEFSSDLYNALRKREAENLIFSPYSVSAVAAMLKAGARGETSKDIQNAFKFPYDDQLNTGYKELIEALNNNDAGFTLETANKVYAQTGYEIKPEYLDTVSKHYGAGVEELDFNNSATTSAQHINDFVAKTTRDKIKNVTSPEELESPTRLFLLNAIYFKGSWKNKFDANDTEEGDFNLNNKDKVKVQMMKIVDNFPFAEIKELNARAISLSYEGDSISMLILIPNDIEGLSQMEEKLTSFPLSTIQDRLEGHKIDLTMPKFTLESTIHLETSLTELGAGSIFDESVADFSGISEAKSFFVSKFMQKAIIEVNESGTEAAAATGCSVTDGPTPKAVIPPIKVVIDRPFLFNIVWTANESGRSSDESNSVPMILFQGTFVRPISSAFKKSTTVTGKTKR